MKMGIFFIVSESGQRREDENAVTGLQHVTGRVSLADNSDVNDVEEI